MPSKQRPLPLVTALPLLRHPLPYRQEMRLREGMSMMGLTTSAYLCSWAVTAVAQFALSALLIAAVTSGSVYQCAPARLRLCTTCILHCVGRCIRGAYQSDWRSNCCIPFLLRFLFRRSDPLVIFTFFAAFGGAASSLAFLVRSA